MASDKALIKNQMNVFQLVVTTIFFGLINKIALSATQFPQINLSSKVELEDHHLKITSELTIKNWQTTDGRNCLYLPSKNPYYPWRKNTFRHLEPTDTKKIFPEYNSRDLNVFNIAHTSLRADIIEISSTTNISLTAIYSEQIDDLKARQDILIDGFYPIPLQACPSREQPKPPMYTKLAHKSTISYPNKWQLIDPSQSLTEIFNGPKLSLILTKNHHHLEKLEYISYLGKSPLSDETKETLLTAMGFFRQSFTKFPFESLTIVETDNIASQALPGLIVIRPPRQQALKVLQNSYLNWHHWALVALISAEWYGVAISETDPIDRWLVDGINDFIAGEALTFYTKRNNFFNSYQYDFSLLSFNYHQLQDITASLLAIRNDLEPLVDESSLESLIPYYDQNPLLFIRHTMAMRHLKYILGSQLFTQFLKNSTDYFLHRSITPKDFVNQLMSFIELYSPQKKLHLNKWLKWWSTTIWPDFSLHSFKTEQINDHQWLSHVSVETNSAFSDMIDLEVKTANDQIFQFSAENNSYSQLLTSQFITSNKPISVTINPKRSIFENNRFNNSSDRPSIKFFPGNATTLSDSDFTVIWLPYLFRRPGEPVSFGLQASFLKYTQSSLFINIAKSIDNDLYSFLLQQRHFITNEQMSFGLSYEHRYDGQRTAEAKLSKPLAFGLPFKTLVSLAVRHKQSGENTSSAHQSIAIPVEISPRSFIKKCHYILLAESEYAPYELSSQFAYRRHKGKINFNCGIANIFEFDLSGFRGVLKGSSQLPIQTYFRPNDLQEAKIHIDQTHVEPVKNITSFGFNLLLPLKAALPDDLFVLKNELKTRIFYDIGQSTNPDKFYSSAGLGVMLPFGGDITGAGTLTLTRLTALAILYSNVDGNIRRKPSFVFDLTGEL